MVMIPYINVELSGYALIAVVILIGIILILFLTKKGKQTTRTDKRSVQETGLLFLMLFLGLVGVGYILDAFNIVPFKGGPLLMLLLIGVAIVIMYRLATGDVKFEAKDLTVMFVVLVLIIVTFIVLPKYLPHFYSLAAQELQDTAGHTIQSMVSP